MNIDGNILLVFNLILNNTLNCYTVDSVIICAYKFELQLSIHNMF